MSRTRIAVLERLSREHRETRPKWADMWDEEARQLRDAYDRASGQRMARAWAKCQSPEYRRQLAQQRRMRRRRPD